MLARVVTVKYVHGIGEIGALEAADIAILSRVRFRVFQSSCAIREDRRAVFRIDLRRVCGITLLGSAIAGLTRGRLTSNRSSLIASSDSGTSTNGLIYLHKVPST